MSSDDTREQILDAAESLFSEKGFEGASMRQIMNDAGANLAAGHYHFGSKENLLLAVLERRIGPLNEERLRMLEELEAASVRRKRLPVEGIIRALVAPPLYLSRDAEGGGAKFMRLLGRILSEPNKDLHKQFMSQFDEVSKRFLPAFKNALPGMPEKEGMWRLYFVMGTMAHTIMDTEKLQYCSHGLAEGETVEGVIDRMVRFCAAGLKAPLPKEQES